MKKTLLYLIFFLYSFNSFSQIVWQNYIEKISFTDEGREVEVKVKGQVKLDKNYFYKEWEYIFDKKSKIKILEAKVVNKKYKTSFGTNNHLKFEFENAFNNDFLEFYFKYIDYNENTKTYARQEYVSIPNFFNGANASLIVQVPKKYAIYSLNPLFKTGNYNYNYEIYNWDGKVQKEGFTDLFYLTLRKTKWKVNILSKVMSYNKPINKIDIIIPAYFKNGNSEIENYNIKVNQEEEKTKINNDNQDIKINLNKINSNNIEISLNATLNNDIDKKIWVKLNPYDYLTINENLKNQLKNIIYNNIHPTSNKPLYISIGEWVNKYIIYDENYFAKELTTTEILNNGRGVCSHYAQLYNDLLRSVGISSILVSGESYNVEKQQFEGHAWNLIHYNGEWIQVDPTWGLFSGKLPASHIFFFLENKPVIKYTIYNTNDINSVKSEVKKDIQFIEENKLNNNY